MWEWTKHVQNTDEINNKCLIVKEHSELTAWHVAAKACNADLLEKCGSEIKTTDSRAVKLQDVLNERYKGKNSLTRGSREGPPRGIVQLVGGV